jgi:hypothetical protein
MAVQNNLPADRDGRIIHAGSSIRHIANTSITTACYTAITVPANVFCKAILIKTRAANAFRLATSESPSEYATFSAQVALNISLREGDILGYIRSDTVSDELEIVYLD